MESITSETDERRRTTIEEEQSLTAENVIANEGII